MIQLQFEKDPSGFVWMMDLGGEAGKEAAGRGGCCTSSCWGAAARGSGAGQEPGCRPQSRLFGPGQAAEPLCTPFTHL